MTSKPSTDSGLDIERELTRIYNSLNKEFWNNELPEVIITFAPTKGALGHLTGWCAWKSGDQGKIELNISALTLNRSPNEIVGTVLHEQCHLYAYLHDIRDTSNAGRHHNKKFKQIAESHGLIVETKKNDYHGYAHTYLTEEAKRFVKKIKVKEFKFNRIPHANSANSHPLKKMVCPNWCSTYAYVSTPQLLLCGICESPLVVFENKK